MWCVCVYIYTIQIKLRWALFVTYTIIQSIMRSEMCSLHLNHQVHTLGAGGSWLCGRSGTGAVVDFLPEPGFKPTKLGLPWVSSPYALSIRPRSALNPCSRWGSNSQPQHCSAASYCLISTARWHIAPLELIYIYESSDAKAYVWRFFFKINILSGYMHRFLCKYWYFWMGLRLGFWRFEGEESLMNIYNVWRAFNQYQ